MLSVKGAEIVGSFTRISQVDRKRAFRGSDRFKPFRLMRGRRPLYRCVVRVIFWSGTPTGEAMYMIYDDNAERMTLP